MKNRWKTPGKRYEKGGGRGVFGAFPVVGGRGGGREAHGAGHERNT